MCAQSSRTGDPYKLAGSRLVFCNWYYINPGSFTWNDNEGNNVFVTGDQGPLEAAIHRSNEPWGIRLAVRNAVRTGPVFNVEQEWEDGGVSISTIIKEESSYRAWGSSSWGDLKKGRKLFCYFESDNGYDWKRPDCHAFEMNGSRSNNILGEMDSGTVFVDPTSKSERYKYILCEEFTQKDYEDFIKQRPEAFELKSAALANKSGVYMGVRGAVSSDGINWTIIPEPLVMTMSDTQIVAYYDETLNRYVVYLREWPAGSQAENDFDEKEMDMRWKRAGRRSIGRAETDDFRKFPLGKVILEPGPDMLPNEVFYTNCRTAIPGAPDHHLMFPTVWNMGTDTTHIVLATSRDGEVWHRMPGNPVLETACFGEWDGGCVFSCPNLIELPNGDFALPYVGYNVPHKYPRMKAERNTGYALWPKGRMLALEAPDRGEFTTVAIVPPGKKLLINAVTDRGGYIVTEACDLHGIPLPGRDFAQSVPLFGDLYKIPVVWNSTDLLGIDNGEAVILRFKMNRAAIYSLDFV